MSAIPYARRQFPGGAVFTTVPNGIGQFDASCTLFSGDNWPSSAGGDFYVGVDFNEPTFEKILCTGTSGLSLSFASGGRGADGTTAVGHAAGCQIFVCSVAQDDDEANQAVNLIGNGAVGKVLLGGGTSTLATWGSVLTPISKSAAYTANPGDFVQVDASGGAVPITVPITDGAITAVKKMDATNGNAVTISPASGTIDGAAHLKLYGQYAGYLFVGDGTNANVVATTSSVWQAYTPSWEGASTNPAIGNGSITARFQQNGQTISVKLDLFCGSTSTFGSGQWWITLPSSAQGGGSLTNLFGSASAGSTYYLCQAVGEGNSNIVGLQVATTGAQVTTSAPATQNSSSYFSFSGSYETL